MSFVAHTRTGILSASPLRQAKSPTASATRYDDIFAVVEKRTVWRPVPGPGLSEMTRPFEIAMSKILANSLVVTVAVGLSLYFVVEKLLAVPVAGSFTLFMCGTALYLFFSTAIGIFLATIARTMPQLGLLFLLVAVPLNLLSGSNTPLESMPAFLRAIMQASPSTHYVSIAQAILYRGAGFETVWPQFLEVAVIGGIFLGLGLLRFRSVAARSA